MTQKETKTTKNGRLRLLLFIRAAMCLRSSSLAWFPFVPILLIVPVVSPAAAPETPSRGGTLRLAFRNEFGLLDPAINETTDDWAVQRFIFRGLFDYDDQNRLILEQAQDWSLSADRKTYTFHLFEYVFLQSTGS